MTSALSQALKRRGTTALWSQRILRRLCDEGRVEAVVEALAQALLFEGVEDGLIPQPVGSSKEVADRAEAGIVEVVGSYHARGGVVLAKNYVVDLTLVAEMAKQWIQALTPTLPAESWGLEYEERNARLAVAAQVAALHVLDRSGALEAEGLDLSVKNRPAAMQLLSELASDPDRRVALDLPAAGLEGFCRQIVDIVYRTATNPEPEIHAALHGRTRSDVG